MIEKYTEWRQLLGLYVLSMAVMTLISSINGNEDGKTLFAILMWIGVGPYVATVIYVKKLERRDHE